MLVPVHSRVLKSRKRKQIFEGIHGQSYFRRRSEYAEEEKKTCIVRVGFRGNVSKSWNPGMCLVAGIQDWWVASSLFYQLPLNETLKSV